MSFGLTRKTYDMVDTNSIQVNTPEGQMFVFINEHQDKLVSIYITIGKSGSGLSAWCYAVSQLMTGLIERGASINDLIVMLSNITSDRSTYSDRRQVKSSVDGVVYALHRHIKFKNTPSRKIPNLQLPWAS